MSTDGQSIGSQLRQWRLARKNSQFDLALQLGISAKHVSFLETGRATPSRDMILRITDHLSVPVMSRNHMVMLAGYAPALHAPPLERMDMQFIEDGLSTALQKHEPYPAIVVDPAYDILLKNQAYSNLVRYFAGNPECEAEPNAMRVLLSRDGLRNAIADLETVESFMLTRLSQEAETQNNSKLKGLYADLARTARPTEGRERPLPLTTITLRKAGRHCSLFSTVTTLGTPTDWMTQGIRLELFFPADESSRVLLESL